MIDSIDTLQLRAQYEYGGALGYVHSLIFQSFEVCFVEWEAERNVGEHRAPDKVRHRFTDGED